MPRSLTRSLPRCLHGQPSNSYSHFYPRNSSGYDRCPCVRLSLGRYWRAQRIVSMGKSLLSLERVSLETRPFDSQAPGMARTAVVAFVRVCGDESPTGCRGARIRSPFSSVKMPLSIYKCIAAQSAGKVPSTSAMPTRLFACATLACHRDSGRISPPVSSRRVRRAMPRYERYEILNQTLGLA